MNVEEIRDFVLTLADVEECLPFGPDNLVYKVGGKMFLLLALDRQPLAFNAKSDPNRALELRAQYPEAVKPGYHMNKTHWNTIYCLPGCTATFLKEQIIHSYELVSTKVKKRPNKK
jgi:predicted DNA-binding protein (MmcQ/YjbR family)